MKRWIVVIAAGLLILLVALLLVMSPRGFASVPAQGTSPFTPPLEVGKTYRFGVNGSDLIGKVVAEPRGNWVQVEVEDSGKIRTFWLNLLQVSYILPDPPAALGSGRRGGAC
jgi:hypothetical protein